jgi:hypothetical protein
MLAYLRRISVSLQSIDHHLFRISNAYVSEWEKKNIRGPRKPVEVGTVDWSAIDKDYQQEQEKLRQIREKT